MKLFIQVFIAVIPLIFSFSTSDPTLNIRFFSFSIFISLLLLYQIFKNSKVVGNIIRHPIFWCLILLELSFLLSSLVNGFNAESVYLLLKFFLLFLFTFILTDFLLKYNYKDLFLSFLFFSLFTSLIYIYQFLDSYEQILSIDDIWHRNRAFDRISGSMGHKNLLASIQFLMLPSLIYLVIKSRTYMRFLALLSLLLVAFLFFQTQSRALFGAIIISFIAFFFISKFSFKGMYRFIISIMLFLLLGIGLVYSTGRLDSFKKEITKTIDFSSSQRFSLYNSSLKLIFDNPILGVGPGNWKINIWEYNLYFNTFGDSFAQRPHNDFLWVFSEGGFLAGLSYLLIFLILLRDSYLLYKKSNDSLFFGLLFCVIVGYGFISMLDFPLERLSHVIIFFLIAAIIISSKIKNVSIKEISLPNWLKTILLFMCFFTVYVGFIRYNGEVHATNALKLKQRNNWNYVIKAIDKAYSPNYYDIENTSTPLLWYRGVAYFNTQKYDLALEDFKNAYNVNPNHVHVLNNLATSYEMIGNHDKAKMFYNQVFIVNPTFKEARVNLSAILYNEKDYTNALDVILQSKVDLFWKRQLNKDNYDFYLRTIFKAWVNQISSGLDENNIELLDDFVDYFEKHPVSAERKLRAVYEKKVELGIDYIAGLLIIEEERKTHKKFLY